MRKRFITMQLICCFLAVICSLRVIMASPPPGVDISKLLPSEIPPEWLEDDDEEEEEKGEEEEGGEDGGGGGEETPAVESEQPKGDEVRLLAAQQQIDALTAGIPDVSVYANDPAYKNLANEITAIQQTLKDTGYKMDAITLEKVKAELAEKQKAQEEIKIRSAYSAGDPVLVTSGRYTDYEVDATITSFTAQFHLSRTYHAGSATVGSLGQLWVSSLDARLIFGTAPESRQLAAATYDDAITPLEENLNALKADYAATFGKTASQWAEILPKVHADHDTLIASKNELEAMSYEMRRLVGYNTNTKCDSETRALDREYKQLIEDVNGRVAESQRLLAQCTRVDAEIRDREGTLSSYRAQYAIYQREAALSDQVSRMNAPALFPGTPAFCSNRGLSSITLIDEKGNYALFSSKAASCADGAVEAPSGAAWVPEDTAGSEYVSLTKNGTVYTVLRRDGSRLQFLENGLMCAMTDVNGNGITLSRNKADRITEVLSASGNGYYVIWSGNTISGFTNIRDLTCSIKFGYSGGKLTSVTDSDGDTVTYQYEQDTISSITKCDGTSIRLSYGMTDSSGNPLTTETSNEEGFSEHFDYDTTAHTTLHEDHDGVRTLYRYDADHRLKEILQADGTRISYDYDAAGNLSYENQNGNIQRHMYDSYGNKTRTTYGDGSSETWTYDALGNILTHADRDGCLQEFERDSRGNVTAAKVGGRYVLRNTYLQNGLLATQTLYGSVPQLTVLSYDAYGNVIKAVNAERTKEWTYDDQDRVISETMNGVLLKSICYDGRKVTVTESNGLETVYTTDGRKDTVSCVTRDTVTGEVRTRLYEYDGRHLPTAEYCGDDACTNIMQAWKYTPAGTLEAKYVFCGEGVRVLLYGFSGEDGVMQSSPVTMTQFLLSNDAMAILSPDSPEGILTLDVDMLASHGEGWNTVTTKKALLPDGGYQRTVTYQDGSVTRYRFDGDGRLILTEDELGIVSRKTYSPAGRLLTETGTYGGTYEYAYDSAGNLVSVKEQGGKPLRRTYNADGSLASETDRLGNTTTYAYDCYGQLISCESPFRKSWFSYDCFGRMTRFVLGPSDDPQTSVAFTDYIYGSDNRSLTVMEGGLYEQRFDINAWSEITAEYDADGPTARYEHDCAGNVTASVDPYGNRTESGYDISGNRLYVTLPDGSSVRYGYDAEGNCTGAWDQEGVMWEKAYDSRGRLSASWSRAGTAIEYAYDSRGRNTATKEAGDVVSRTFYDDGAGTVLHYDGKGCCSTFLCDSFGRVIQETDRNGERQQFFYNADGNVDSAVDFNGKTTSYSTVPSASGNGYVRTTTYADGTSTCFIYDMAGNLVEMCGNGAHELYQYDRGGKLILQKNLYTGGTISYSYDSRGNLTYVSDGDSFTSRTYGRKGELLSVTDGLSGSSVSFTYDILGNETLRVFGNGSYQSTEYDHIGRQVLICQKSSTGAVLWGEGSVYGQDGRVVATVTEDARIALYSYDSHGRISEIARTDSSEVAAEERTEALEHGLDVENARSLPENLYLSASLHAKLSSLLEMMKVSSGSSLNVLQIVRKEHFTYDEDGNRLTKTTPYGTIVYSYDNENRMISAGGISPAGQAGGASTGITYIYDPMGNLLSESGVFRTAEYAYSPSNRMVGASVSDVTTDLKTVCSWSYDPIGRRISSSYGSLSSDGTVQPCSTTYTMYSGLSFERFKEFE